MTRAKVQVTHPVHGRRVLDTIEPGALVDVAAHHGATQIVVYLLCDVEGCTHPPAHNGPHRFQVPAP